MINYQEPSQPKLQTELIWQLLMLRQNMPLPGRINTNGGEPYKTCLGRVFNFKLGRFDVNHVIRGIHKRQPSTVRDSA
jgi:hypothetical protein